MYYFSVHHDPCNLMMFKSSILFTMNERKLCHLRFIKFLFKTVIILAVLGVGIYFVGTHFLASKVADVVTEELESSGQLDEARRFVDQTPELKQMLESSANVDASTLPFTTKEDAIKTVVKKVGVRELHSIQNRYANGMSQAEQIQLIEELEDKLTEEEAAALKYIIYNELYK